MIEIDASVLFAFCFEIKAHYYHVKATTFHFRGHNCVSGEPKCFFAVTYIDDTMRSLIIYLFISTLFGCLLVQGRGAYVGNLTDVLGDVKQGQIRNSLNTKAKVDNVLDGFKKLGCNGVRITIFAEGANPNVEMYDYLYRQAKARGFKIFANPAQGAGGIRIANGIMDLQEGGTGPSVLDSDRATNALVERIMEFSSQYPCDWICPFNEDARPGRIWSTDQINTVFAKLNRRLGGAKLVGPCTWGVGASIELFEKTNLENYVSVATTHNLGFEHEEWATFIKLARAKRLPVWDSEVNHIRKVKGRATRLEAALIVGVDGLVLYHAWKDYVNLKTGELTGTGLKVKKLILAGR